MMIKSTVMLVNYQYKQKKNIHLMSTMHDSPATDTTEKNKRYLLLQS